MPNGRGSRNNKKVVPGPGAYNPEVRASKDAAPIVGIGTSKRDGAGAYKDAKTPGPGNYNIRNAAGVNSPAIGIGTGLRPKTKGSDVPGPGAYKIPYLVADVPSYVLPNRTEDSKFR